MKQKLQTSKIRNVVAIPGTIPPIASQSAKYARLFMSAQPFIPFEMLSHFPPIFDMFESTETLISVVRTMECCLLVDSLGFHPTVHVLTDLETQKLTGNTKYPSTVESSCGNDPRPWYTRIKTRAFGTGGKN